MFRFSLAQLEALLAISKQGSFQAAAAQLNITQPTISLRIRELENALGVQLFERNGRSMRPSVDGVIALHHAERAIELLSAMEARLRSGDPLQGTLRVGTSEMIAMAILPQIMSLLGDRYPRIEVELTVANSFVLEEDLVSGKLDVAFLANPSNQTLMHIEPLSRAPIAWVSGRVLKQTSGLMTPRALADLPVLCMPKHSPLHRLMAQWWEQEGGVDLSVSTCNSLAMLARMVAAGLGASVLPTCVLREEIQQGAVTIHKQLRPFTYLNICAAYPKKQTSAGIAAIISIVRKIMLESKYFDLQDSATDPSKDIRISV